MPMHRSIFSPRRLIGTTAVAGAATLASLAAMPMTPSSGAPASASSASKCATSGLVIWLNTPPGNGAAGSRYYDLQLTNLSGRPCTLRGYPGVSAVDLRGRQLGGAASREPFQTPRKMTIARGVTVTAVLRIVEAGILEGCREVTAAGLRVYPPGQTASKVVPFPFRTCAGRGHGNLSVRAVGPEQDE